VKKFLFDLFPVLLFFAAFKLAGMFPDASLALAQSALGPLMIDGRVPVDQAPILLATAVAIVASLLQVGWLLLRGRKVDAMLWVSLGVIVFFGGATIWLHDESFIKWKPTILYWLFGGILLGGRLGWNRNFVRSVLGAQITVPEPVWEKLLWMWIVFFAAVGTVNIAVAYSVPTATWVNFKLFGLMGLTFAFTIGMGFWLARHMPDSGGERG
jgi:intracellular septation protein